MAEANAEQRLARLQQLLDHRNGVDAGRGGVARAVRQENAVGGELDDLFEAGGGGDDRDVRACRDEIAEDVAFGAVVDRDDVGSCLLAPLPACGRGLGGGHILKRSVGGQISPTPDPSRKREGGRKEGDRRVIPLAQSPNAAVPAIIHLRRHRDREVHAFQPRPRLRLCQERRYIERPRRRMRDHPVGRATTANPPRQRAGIDARQPDPPVLRHPRVEPLGRAEIAWPRHLLAHDDAHRVRVVRLEIVGIRADIADMRKGEGDHLPGKARVGHDLLITRHRGVETHFADRSTFRAEAMPPNHVARGEHQNAGGTLRSFGRRGNGLGVGHCGGHSSGSSMSLSDGN